jgi:putative tryptophan/tyrosine transport system substrate-binding protein
MCNPFERNYAKSCISRGYIEGQNLVFEIRSAEEKLDLLPKLAAELVSLKVDVIVALYMTCPRDFGPLIT